MSNYEHSDSILNTKRVLRGMSNPMRGQFTIRLIESSIPHKYSKVALL